MRAKITFHTGQTYEYEFKLRPGASIEEMAFAISSAKHAKEHKTKYTGVPDSYELILGMLKNKNIQFSGKQEPVNYFQDASYRNSLEKVNNGKKIAWRVGISFSNRLVIDIDNHNEENQKRIIWFYSRLFEKLFYKVKTNHGYWLILRKKYDSLDDWKYDNARLLSPGLQRCDMEQYLKEIGQLDYPNKKFVPMTSVEFTKTKYFQGVGNFDIAFTRLSLKRERTTLRISKKTKDDNIEVIA